MGRDGHFICQDCKVNILLGYGSYSGWLCPNSDINAVADYDALPNVDDEKKQHRNIMFRKAISEHEGHDWLTYSDDWCWINEETQDLEMESGWGRHSILAKNVGNFRRENWSAD